MSDYMQEARKLLRAVIDTTAALAACGSTGSEYERKRFYAEETRAALLAHIERGQALEGWRDDVHLAAQMLTWGHSDGDGMTARQEDEVRQHQKKLFAMLAAH